MHDIIYKSHIEKSVFDIDSLRRLLEEGEKLPFKCSEVLQLRNLLMETDSWTKASTCYLQRSGMHLLFGQPKQFTQYPASNALNILTSFSGNNNHNNKNIRTESLEELSDLLWRAQANPLYLPEKKALEELYDKALVFMSKVEEMMDANSNARLKKARYVQRNVQLRIALKV